MSDHLPECRRWFTDMPDPDECPACEMFRACEQRVREEYELERLRAYEKGCKVGVQAARDAVEAIQGDTPHSLPRWVKRDALAAIDALRSES